jgi:SAM-dependent methyltransferase
VREGAIKSLPFDDGRFDLLFATDVIEHLPDDGPALDELRRVAAPGARLIITVPAYNWLWSQHDTSWHHYRRYTRPRLRERVRAHGWEPTAASYFYSTLLPPVAAVRTLQRLRSNGNGKSDLHLSPGVLNRWLELPVRGEAKLIERGASLPVGVSLGMVCTLR